jgi:hypothetical protein
LGAGLTIQPRKKVIVTKTQQGPNWAVEPYDDDDDDDEVPRLYEVVIKKRPNSRNQFFSEARN